MSPWCTVHSTGHFFGICHTVMPNVATEVGIPECRKEGPDDRLLPDTLCGQIPCWVLPPEDGASVTRHRVILQDASRLTTYALPLH